MQQIEGRKLGIHTFYALNSAENLRFTLFVPLKVRLIQISPLMPKNQAFCLHR